MNEGWKCPECGRCYAPWVPSCDASDCGTVGGGFRITPGVECDHQWASGTGGTYCIKCGVRSTYAVFWDGSDGSHDACGCDRCRVLADFTATELPIPSNMTITTTIHEQ